jgi:protoporphyrinogen oxidase
MYFPDASLRISRLYEVGNFSKDLVPPGKSCLVVEVPCSVGDPDWRLQEKHLVRKVVEDLEKTGLVSESEIVASRVMSLPDAYPVYHRGCREQIDICCEFLREIPGMISTGRQGLFCYNNADHSIDMGIQAAETAAEGPEGTARFYDLREEFSKYRIVD